MEVAGGRDRPSELDLATRRRGTLAHDAAEDVLQEYQKGCRLLAQNYSLALEYTDR
ncbi:hypothetical protein TRIUR3_06286 [Triticum urartu]|uniref:Uncharacterized protein n=1 Tax=Triticum urartu TaxID=4572 RepID=M7ZF93_TRIUA|nr:hypothetical protein TRIUR3_06286 [Triticum urartu]